MSKHVLGSVVRCTVWLGMLPAVLSAQTLSDPTVPLGRSATTASHPAATGWQLQSTRVGSGRRIAIINGRIVGEGDSIDGAKVERIAAGHVRLSVNGRRIELPITSRVDRDEEAKRVKP